MTNAPGRFRATAVQASAAQANAGPTVWWRLGTSSWLLLLLWGRRENGLTIFGNARPGNARNRPPTGPRQRAAAIPEEAQKLLGGRGTARSDYLADAPPAPRRRRASRAEQSQQAAAAAPPVPATPAEMIDVNTANQRTLARLTGMDRGLAKTVIADRARRGGFGSLEDFAASAGLQPHELVRLRAEAFCSARPRAKRSFSRRVDY